MTSPNASRGLGLYALKPAFRSLLTPVLRACDRHGVTPNTLSLLGVISGAAAGAALAWGPPAAAVLVVGPALVARLAAANLDGTLARHRGETSRWGAVVNEASDRAADLLALAGLLALAPVPAVLAAMGAATLPSWVSLAGAAAGAERIQGGPVGKTERAAVLVAVSAVPATWAAPAALAGVALIGTGSAVTAVVRLHRLHRGLVRGSAPAA